MPGASEQTSQVKVLNVNWTAGADAEDGRFEVMIVTADGEKHTFAPSPASLTVAGSGQDRRHPAMGSCRPDRDRRQHRRNLDRPTGLTRVEVTTPMSPAGVFCCLTARIWVA